MKFSRGPLNGIWIIETEFFQDKRGKFGRLFCQNELREINHYKPIEQVNYSFTLKKGMIRGIHFQHPPKAEVKLIRCLHGTIFDVMVDLRRNSPTFLQWCGEILSQENKKMVYIPEGFAHGFQALEDNCEMLYLHTEFYSPSHDGGLRYDDPRIGIEWPLEVTEVSERDKHHPLLTSEFSGITV